MKPWEKYAAQNNTAASSVKPWEKYGEAKEPTYLQKAGRDLGQTLWGMTPMGMYQAGKTLGESAARDLETKRNETKTGKKGSYLLPEIGKSMVEPYAHPLKSLKEGRVASTALAWTIPTSIVKKGLAPVLSKPKTLPLSELIGGKLERSTVENTVNNPHVSKNMSLYASEDINEVVNDAAQSTMAAKNKIKTAQNYIFQKAGITDDMVLPVDKVSEHMQKIGQYVDDFSGSAIGENKAAAGKAKGLLDDMVSMARQKPLTYGQLKQLTKQVYDLADSNVTDMGRHTQLGSLYARIGKELTETKKSLLPIKEASKKYAELMEAEEILNDTLRLDKVTGELTLPMKIMRRFKDAEHGQFKAELEKVNNIFKKNADILKENPETADMINEYGNAAFVDKMKLTQALHDVTSKRAVTPQGIGRIPMLAYATRFTGATDPLKRMSTLAWLAQKGLKAPVTKEIPVSPYSRSLTKLSAYSELIPGLKPLAKAYKPAAKVSVLVNRKGNKEKE